jgi:NAD(P)-dependent dehydrogenase (short-subunit alcohol dehydrogenase family)
MDLGLTGKAAVVTGASKGIGLAVTGALVAEGAEVVAVARSLSPALEKLVANNVGAVTHRLTGFLDISEDDWAHTWNLDVIATVRAIKAAIPLPPRSRRRPESGRAGNVTGADFMIDGGLGKGL